jgi:ribosome-binding factor A
MGMRAYRADKMGSLLREVISDTIANKLQDPRISNFASVTRVEVSGDLGFAKVYISVMGPETAGRTTLRGLENARGIIQRAVAKSITARTCPQVRFILDTSIKKASEIIALIDANVPHPEAADELSEVEDAENEDFADDLEDFARDDEAVDEDSDLPPPSDGVVP